MYKYVIPGVIDRIAEFPKHGTAIIIPINSITLYSFNFFL